MDPMRNDRERDRLESTWDRWRRLPLGYRINACLYVLAFIALVGLLAQVVSGDGGSPRRVDVASQAPTTTRPKPTTTTAIVTTVPLSLPTTTPAPKVVISAPPLGSGASTGKASSGGGATAQPTDTTPIPGLPLPPNCQNSSDPACGDFSWSPPASNNLPITINVDRTPSVVGAGSPVQFTVVVSDADHPVSDNCAVVNYGDGSSDQAPCQPLNCPATFGPWTPPARVAGSMTFTYNHTYAAAGSFTPTFEFHTDRDRCPDPYGNFGQGSTTVTVN